MTIATYCPDCNRPYALIGRVHRCVPRQPQVHSAGNPAGTQAIGAYKSAMCETPPATGEDLHSTANRGEPAPISNVVPIRKPKRDRAKYMRDYRARKKNAGSAA